MMDNRRIRWVWRLTAVIILFILSLLSWRMIRNPQNDSSPVVMTSKTTKTTPHRHQFITVLKEGEGDMPALRSLVGSIHQASPTDHFLVYVFESNSKWTPGIPEEIGLWRRVQYIPIERTILNLPANEKLSSDLWSDTDWRHRFDKLLVTSLFKDYNDLQVLIAVELGTIVTAQILSSILEEAEKEAKRPLKGQGFQIYLRGNYELNGFSPSSLQLPIRLDSSHHCNMEIKSEAIFTPLFTRKSNNQINSDDKRIKVSLLVPTANFEFKKREESPLLQHLLTSLVNTITKAEQETYTITLYVGYDRNDPLFDLQHSQMHQILLDLIKAKNLQETIFIVYQRLPRTKWLTLIWNRLFVQAYADGMQYFLQVNDDVKFIDSGWISAGIRLLRDDQQDFGVVGLNDELWQCGLFTQAMVSRRHYDVFHGHFFPLGIKDWYSDNWISNVYRTMPGDRAFSQCLREHRVKNGAVETRYEACGPGRWMEIAQEGMIRAQQYRLELGL